MRESDVASLGSPHFFCGDVDVFCPSLTITKDPVKGTSILRDTSPFLTDFLARCPLSTAASADNGN